MATATKLEEARDRVAGALAAKEGADPAAVGPEWLGLIGEAVLAVLEDCLAARPAEQVAAAMRRPGPLEWLAARRAVRRVLNDAYGPLAFQRHAGPALVEALLAASRDATDEDRAGLVREVGGLAEA